MILGTLVGLATARQLRLALALPGFAPHSLPIDRQSLIGVGCRHGQAPHPFFK